MGLRVSHLPLRLAAGGFVLNSGLGKLQLDREGAAGLQHMAANAFPRVASIEPEKFGKLLSYTEICLGAALLAPFIPSRLVGLGLTAFSAATLLVYKKTPGMTEPDGIRPTQKGIGVAKDVWLLGIALALVLDRRHRPSAA